MTKITQHTKNSPDSTLKIQTNNLKTIRTMIITSVGNDVGKLEP